MKQGIFEILSNEALTSNVYKMVLLGDTSAITAPGQFVNIQLSGMFLRRPISVCDYDSKTLTIIYKVVGKGTQTMSTMTSGEKLDILTGLGNGYDLSLSGDAPVLLGGGVGVPPMYNLAKRLMAQGKTVSVILGFNTNDEVFYEKEFKDLGCTGKIGAVAADSSVDQSVRVNATQVDGAVVELDGATIAGEISMPANAKLQPRSMATPILRTAIRKRMASGSLILVPAATMAAAPA